MYVICRRGVSSKAAVGLLLNTFSRVLEVVFRFLKGNFADSNPTHYFGQ
jgi:hypothetical protein